MRLNIFFSVLLNLVYPKSRLFQFVDYMCQFMDVSKIDEVLANFLIRYEVYTTFKYDSGAIKRQFSLRGLIIDEQNFPKTILSMNDRRKILPKPVKKRRRY